MKPRFSKLLGALGLAFGSLAFANSAAATDDLFISEYVEGSSYNKAIEIFNNTGKTIDLSTYQLKYYFNGKTSAGRTITLNGSLANGEVFVIAQNKATPALKDLANQTDTSTSWFNGDDAVVLLNNGDVIDSIGQVGTDPGSQWGSGLNSTKDNTIRRTVCEADTNEKDAFDPTVQWEGFAQNTYDGIGFHSCGDTPPGGGDEPVDPPTEPPAEIVKIHDVQGSGAASPLEGQTVTVEAIVVGDFQDKGLNGFFIQEEDADADGNAQTSEGVFVYDGSSDLDVQVGDKVRVEGLVKEYYDLTELTNVKVTVMASFQPMPTPVQVNLPLASETDMEAFEGMSVVFPQKLTVTENYNLGRYGQFWLSANGRLMNPTNVVAPGAPAIAYGEGNDLNRILVDDANSSQNPDPIIYPNGELTAANTLRSGSTTQDLQGVVFYSYGDYQIQPTSAPVFNDDNPRTLTPMEVGGSLKVASFNVLNYFNGDGLGGGFPTARGADNAEEFERQRVKIINAIINMDADIIGLMEVENDGFGANSAIADLVKGLNDIFGANTYAFVNPGVSQIGTDEIAVGLIYKTATVQAMGNAAILDSSVDPTFNDNKNRPVLAQTFKEIASNGMMTIAVNHLKSKGSSCDSLGDPDVGDGQGNCNLTRTTAAQALVNWLNTDPTNSNDADFMIIGDLNAYAMEDPISAIKTAGYTDLVKEFNSGNAYSYIYYGEAGYLDHALSSETLTSQVTGVTEWHINTDEPKVLDYNTEYKSDNQVLSLYSPEHFRASDHDPVIIGLNLMPSVKTVAIAEITEEVVQKGTGRRAHYVVGTSVVAVDGKGQPVQGAIVFAQWSLEKAGRVRTRSVSCTTDESGGCDFSIRTRQTSVPYTFRIESITHPDYEYDLNLNVESEIIIPVTP